MDNKQLQRLIKQTTGVRRKRRLLDKFAVPFEWLEDELRTRYGSLSLALEFIPLGMGAYKYRKRVGLFPEQDRWMLDFLLTNDLKTLTGVEIPEDYQFKAQHLANRSRSHN